MRKKNKNLAGTKFRDTAFNGGDIAFIILVFVSLVALVTILSLSMQYSSGMNDQAVLLAETYSEDLNSKFAVRVEELRQKTASLAIVAGQCADQKELNSFLTDILTLEKYEDYKDVMDIRYFLGDQEYDRTKIIYKEEEFNRVLEMRDKNIPATYGMLDRADDSNPPCIACYYPIKSSNLVVTDEDDNPIASLEAIVVFFPQTTLLTFVNNLDNQREQKAEFQALCTTSTAKNAMIVSIITDESGQIRENASFFDYLNLQTNNSGGSYDELIKLMEGVESGSMLLELQNEKYVVSVGHVGETDRGLYTVSLYHVKNVYTEGYDLISTIITIMAIFVAVVIIFAVYFFWTRRKLNAKIEEINMVDSVLDCPTQQKFERNIKDILSSYPSTKYVVVISHLQHYSYIVNKYGAGVAVDILRHIKNVIYTSITSEESYGYLTDGDFAILLKFTNEDYLDNMLKTMKANFSKLVSGSLPADYHLAITFGVYIIPENDNEPASKMIDKAMSVRNEPSLMDVKRIYSQYTPVMENTRLRRAEIESRMEKALEDGEFRIFYQPKYDLNKDDIAGAELLVRWYDAERKHYRRPDEFLPVFEENGFISKLDRQIYYTACETLAAWSAKGRRVYPISVNVSRVTAIQDDFTRYYTAVKKKFNIPNDFITLEFTESFAYENYDHLGAITQRLREAGFLCSIDDFGTGSSTFSTLQKLDMDEIKLDRFFILADPLPEKDKIILQNTIALGKKLRLKVVQEGVETREYVRMLRAMGCEVIQGYYFARPMGTEDYEKFVDDFIATGRVLGEEPPEFDKK